MVERKGKSRGLGRGLSSLMGDINNDPISSSVNSENQTLEKLVPVEKIYPNPNHGRFVVESPHQIHKIEISNITGKIIYSKVDINRNIENIDLSMEQKGVYFVKVFLANKSIKTNSLILN